MGLKMKNVNIYGSSPIFSVGGHKKTIYMGSCLKRGAWTIFKGLGKK